MRNRTLVVVALFTLVTGCAAAPAAAQITLTGLTRATFKDSVTSSAGDGAVIKFAKDPALAELLGDPTCNGGDDVELRIRTAARSSTTWGLSCAKWSASRRGFRYKDAKGHTGGVRKIQYEGGKLIIQLKGAGYTVLYGPTPFLEIELRIGEHVFCARTTQFGRNDAAVIAAYGPSSECLEPTFTPTVTPTPTSTPTRTATPVPYCGDGIRQIHEQCDDGNTSDDDCCFSNCQLAGAGIGCMSDGNPCTDDVCDGSGSCQHLDNAAPCSDGSHCTQSDVCSGGMCGGSLVQPWINEVNYDGYDFLVVTRDHEEFVEIAGPAGFDLGGHKLLAIEGAGSGSILNPCLSGNLDVGEAYFSATIPAGTIIQDDTGKGTGFIVLCFAGTSGDIQADGQCDVVLAPMPSSESNLKEGSLSNLFDCADGVLLLGANNQLVDAVSYEGRIPAVGPYGAYFAGAADIGRDWGLATDWRRSLIKTTDHLRRETDGAKWTETGNGGDSPGAVNGIQNLSCYQQPGYTNTQYPIVLMHGLYGFDSLFGLVEYWNGITGALVDGGASVFVTTVSQLNTPQARGEQAIAQIEAFLAQTGKAKVNLIGHSQGGLDARYIAAVRPDLVASVTSVAGPHKGAAVADFLRSNFLNGAFGDAVIALLGNTLGDLLALLSGSTHPNEAIPAIDSLTTAAMAQFNAQYPAAVPKTACGEGEARVNGIYYFSWSGTAIRTNPLDPSDDMFAYTTLVYGEANDGLVGRCSSHLGDVIRDNYVQNHIDEVNLLFGLVSPFDVNPKTLFRQHANRLKNLGL